MARKKGEQYKCDECGLVVMVADPCGCEACELVCCEQPMQLVKAPAKAATSKASAKPAAKATKK